MPGPTPATSSGPRLGAVLDMGASAIRLVVAEIQPRQPIRILEEATRGVPLGRDAFSTGVIRADTVDTALAAVDGFRTILEGYGTVHDPRRGDERGARGAQRRHVPGPDSGAHGHRVRNHQRSRREPAGASVGPPAPGRITPRSRARGRSSIEVGGGGVGLTLLRRGRPNRSGVYAVGSVRMRQQLNLKRHSHDLQVSLLKRYVANVIEEIRVDIPLDRVTHLIAIGGEARFAATQLQTDDAAPTRTISREEFLAFCDQIETSPEEGSRRRASTLPAVEAETLLPALLVYRAVLTETGARRLVVPTPHFETGVLIDMSEPGGRLGAIDFERQVLASADSLGLKYRYDRAHGRHVAMLSTKLFDALMEEHALGGRERLLLQVAALLHDIGVYVNLRAHHKHSLVPARGVADLRADQRRDVPWWPTSRATTGAACRRRAICRTSRSTGRTG